MIAVITDISWHMTYVMTYQIERNWCSLQSCDFQIICFLYFIWLTVNKSNWKSFNIQVTYFFCLTTFFEKWMQLNQRWESLPRKQRMQLKKQMVLIMKHKHQLWKLRRLNNLLLPCKKSIWHRYHFRQVHKWQPNYKIFHKSFYAWFSN